MRFRHSWHAPRMATAARPKSLALRGVGRRKKHHPLASRAARWARWAAINPGGANRIDERSVVAAVARRDSPPESAFPSPWCVAAFCRLILDPHLSALFHGPKIHSWCNRGYPIFAFKSRRTLLPGVHKEVYTLVRLAPAIR